MIKMTGKEMKAYAKRVGLKIKSGSVIALLSSSGKRVQSPIKTISSIPDDARGWFDPSISRFDASTPKTTLKVVFVGAPDPDEEKTKLIRKAERRMLLKQFKDESRSIQKSGSGGPSVYDSGCHGSSSSSC